MAIVWEPAHIPREGEHVSDQTLRKLISEYYTDNLVGGSAHIVFDEGGTSDDVIRYCIQNAVVNGDWVCAGILLELLKRHPGFREAIVK